MYLGHYVSSKDNNFLLLRFIAALMVIYSHSFSLTGQGKDGLYGLIGITYGHVAVDIFFITSGFLVTRSLLNKKRVIPYFLARILRIYPALFIANLFSIFVIGLLFTTLPLKDYILNLSTLSYLWVNSSMIGLDIQFYLPGVFENNVYQNTINGSLWTLPWEIMMYIILGMVGFFPRNIGKYLIILIASCMVVLGLINSISPYINEGILTMMFRLMGFFFLGGSYYIFRERIVLVKKFIFLGIFLILIAISYEYYMFFHIFYILFLPYFVIYLVYVPGGSIRKFNNLGDYSYGLYIYAFPIQQSIGHIYKGIGILEMFIISTLMTLLIAMISWHFIEKPMLDFKKRISLTTKGKV